MGTRLKSKVIYKIALIIAIISFAFTILSGFDVIKNNKYLFHKTYFDTEEFIDDLTPYTNAISSLNTNYKNYEEKPIDEKITKGEVQNLKNSYDGRLKSVEDIIKSKYDSQIETAQKNGDTNLEAKLTVQKNKELDMNNKENRRSLDDIKKELVKPKDDEYKWLKDYLTSRSDIKYYIRDGKTNEIYTNLIKVSNIDNYIQSNALYSLKLPKEASSKNPLSRVSEYFKFKQFEGYFIVPKQLDTTGNLFNFYSNYNSERTGVLKELEVLCISLMLTLVFLRIAKASRPSLGGTLFNLTKQYKKIPFDLRFIIAVICTIGMYYYLYWHQFFYMPINASHLAALAIALIYSGFILSNLTGLISVLRDTNLLILELKSCLLYKLFCLLSDSFIIKSTFFKLTLFTLLNLLLGISICIIIIKLLMGLHDIYEIWGYISIIYVILYCITVPFFTLRKASTLNRILKGTEEIVNGNLDYIIEEKGKGNISKLAHNINNMKSGIKKAVEDQLKSDRLKSELITNVSHDLKTPLTSIINYVGLLKNNELSKDEINGYVAVLDRKTQRLKTLIEDLFEASKVTSGAVELNIEKVDVASLLNQALAELEEKIKNSSLIFKTNIPEHKVYSDLDGKKTWRVFENLIGNILKYSQTGTRVYIDLLEKEDKILITMKNISAYEMDFDVDEIFERFKRGDKSRNTEGSGLGLAIAKSIVELQGGELLITIDGDLFKVTVELKKALSL